MIDRLPDLDKITSLLHRLEALKRATEDSDPDDMAADGVTCAEVWGKELREIAEALRQVLQPLH